MTAKDVVDAARAGDALSLRIVEEAGRVIGMAAAVIGCVVNPKLFVLGGGVSASGDLLLKSVLASYRQ